MVNLIRQQHALQFLPKPEDNAGDFGKILGEALQGLAHHKIQQKQTSNKEKFLVEGGFHPEFARELAKQPDDMIQKVLSGLEGFGTQRPQQQGNNPSISQQINQGFGGNPEQESFGQGGLTPKTNYAAERNQIAREKLNLTKQQGIEKLESPHLEKAMEAHRTAENNNLIADQQLQLINEGNLPDPIFASAIETIGNGVFGAGFDLSSLLGSSGEEFNKLSAQLVNNLRSSGGRVTDIAMKNFIKSIPTLRQSEDGKRKILSNFKLFNEFAKSDFDAKRELIEANGGDIPKGLNLKSSKIAEAKRAELSKMFNEENASKGEQFGTLKGAIEQARSQGVKEFGIENEDTGTVERYRISDSGSVIKVK
jgi:hypothetical protein